MSGMAVYEIEHGGKLVKVRYFIAADDEKDMTPLEVEASEIICNGYEKSTDVIAGRTDPFKAAESILKKHYGSARMVEADYEWHPRIRY